MITSRGRSNKYIVFPIPCRLLPSLGILSSFSLPLLTYICFLISSLFSVVPLVCYTLWGDLKALLACCPHKEPSRTHYTHNQTSHE